MKLVPARIHDPASTSDVEVMAVKALAAGVASADQQRCALYWIMDHAAGIKHDPFDQNNARRTDYFLGRRSVGLQIAALITRDL